MAVTMTSIKFKVTPEEAQPVSDPITYGTMSGDYLSPHSGMQRNSLTGAIDFCFPRMFYKTTASNHTTNNAKIEPSRTQHVGASVSNGTRLVLSKEMFNSTQLMDKFDSHKALRPVRTMMKITATWPGMNPSFLYKIRTKISFSLLAAIGVVSIIQDYNNIEVSLFGFCAGITAIQLFIKHIIMFSKKLQFLDILNYLTEPEFTSHERHLNIYVQRRIRTCNLLQIMLFVSGYTTMSFILVDPVAKQGDRVLIVDTVLNMTQVTYSVYNSFWTFQFLGAGLTVWQMSCFNSLLYSFMAIGAGQLEILNKRIIHATNVESLEKLKFGQKYDDIVNNRLKKCVEQHVAIERFINAVESTFTYAFLAQLLTSMVICCFLTLVCLIMATSVVVFARAFFFLASVMIELAVFCLLGNEIIIQSSTIRDACYGSQWNNCGPLVAKTLFLIMERSKRPLALTAGRFVTLSLETLLAVLRSAFSYFTVIWQLYSTSHKGR